MQINELAELLAVSASTLRHWEKTLEVDVPRDALGQRTYPPVWVAYFQQVKALLDAGKKYAQIKQELTPPAAQPLVPVVPPVEIEEMRAAIARLESGLLQTSGEVGEGRSALVEATQRIDATRADLTRVGEEVEKQSRKLGKMESGLASVTRQVDAVQTDIGHVRAEAKSASDAVAASALKVAELAERVAQLQDGAGGDVAGLQAALKEIEAEVKGCNKSLKQAQKAIEGLQEVQAGTTDEIAGLQKQIAGLQGAPGLSTEELQALKTFKERFWWYMGAIVFLFMVLTISVVEGMR